SYQWDALLLETGLIALVAVPGGFRPRWSAATLREMPAGGRWLLWWLLFRLMFGSGVVKLASGDPAWRSLAALSYHFETQPIPTPIAWYADHLPASLLRASTLVTLAIELAAPWFIAGPRRPRLTACALLLLLQTLIALTGNYAYFNLLSIALC